MLIEKVELKLRLEPVGKTQRSIAARFKLGDLNKLRIPAGCGLFHMLLRRINRAALSVGYLRMEGSSR
jgi:hypothetical protein